MPPPTHNSPDPQALGQLLVMQNCIPLMDSDQRLFSLVNRGLSNVPGVATSAIQLADSAGPAPAGSEGRICLPIETLHERFGWVDLALRDPGAFAPYQPFVRNLTGVIALWLSGHARQRRLEAACARLQHALHERESFLAIVSHDLANPLGAIVNVAQSLKEALPPERVGAAANLIERSARRMSRMLRDLLDLANIDTGHLSIERAPQDIDRLVAESVEEARGPARCKDIALEVHLEAQLPAVLCDGQRVVQVLSNLLGNAVKFTPRGGVVVIRTHRCGGEVQVSVSDSGPGIAADALPHVFERYYRAKDAREGGTGLGLAIAKGILDLHGGQIGVHSRCGEGACFTFSLPALA